MVVGQERLISRVLIALLADGHLLVEGAPGLAKTRTVRAIGDLIHADFQRVQFTPDLLPSDLTGTDIYRPQDASFHFQPGPLFHNLILADEINRAPAKVQSALLEAMAERQVTVGRQTYPLPPLFMVMATQNPLEHEGTYPLPEAQLDRFLMHVFVDYPDLESERRILEIARDEARRTTDGPAPARTRMSQEVLFELRRQVLDTHLARGIEDYILRIVMATRAAGERVDTPMAAIRYGASPRATIALDRCARAHAVLSGRDYVDPGDVQAIAIDVLRHRILLRYEALAEGLNSADVITALLDTVEAP